MLSVSPLVAGIQARQGVELLPLWAMPDTMDLNVTTPNDNPSALVRYVTLPQGEISYAGTRYASLCVVRKKLWKITMS